DHEHPLQALEPVDGGEELVDDPLRDAARVLEPPARGDGVDLVDEHDRRGGLTGLLEDHPDGLLALADPLAHHFGAFHRDEVRLALRRRGLREEGLPDTGRAVEEDAARRLDADVAVDLRVLNGSSTDSSRIRRTRSTPPTCSQWVVGTSTVTSRRLDGSICFNASRKSCSVTFIRSSSEIGIGWSKSISGR